MPPKLEKHTYQLLITLVIALLAFGTVFYHVVEKWSFLNSYYFSVVTLATVGYGDFTPHTSIGKFVTTIYIFIGVGIITTFITYTMRRRAVIYSKRHASKKNNKHQQ